MTLPKQRGFQRALGTYLRQNHGASNRSGKLTRRQARRLRKHYPFQMAERRLILLGPEYKDWH